MKRLTSSLVALAIALSMFFYVPCNTDQLLAQEQTEGEAALDGASASDPLAKTNNIDLKWTYMDESDSTTNLWWIKGNQAFTKWLKLSYELTYARTDEDGEITDGFDVLSLKPLIFFGKGELGSWKYGMATGFELLLDFAEVDSGVGTIQGYGTGADLISPLYGISFSKNNTTLVPLVQHYIDLSGEDVSTTGFRFIGIQKFAETWWSKLDLIVPYDWNNELVPGTVELEVGNMVTPTIGIYASGLAGFADSSLDWGGSINVRYVY